MDAHHGAHAAEQAAHLRERQIGLFLQGGPQGVDVLAGHFRFSAHPVVKGFDVSEFVALLQEFFDEIHGDVKLLGDFHAREFARVITFDDTGAGVERNCFHAAQDSKVAAVNASKKRVH